MYWNKKLSIPPVHIHYMTKHSHSQGAAWMVAQKIHRLPDNWYRFQSCRHKCRNLMVVLITFKILYIAQEKFTVDFLKGYCIRNHTSAKTLHHKNYITTISHDIDRTSHTIFLGLLVSHFMTYICVCSNSVINYIFYVCIKVYVIISEAVKSYNTYLHGFPHRILYYEL